MLTVEREFTVVIYILYAADCVHWLKPGQIAVMRRIGGGWRTRPFRDDSYTLLGRMPVVVNPIDFRPSYLAGSCRELNAVKWRARDIILTCLPDAGMLTLLATFSALNLLVFLPALLLTGYLSAWWRAPASLALFTQLSLAYEVFRQGKAWRRERPGDFWPQFLSMFLNPVAALRSGDILLRGIFGTQSQGRPPR